MAKDRFEPDHSDAGADLATKPSATEWIEPCSMLKMSLAQAREAFDAGIAPFRLAAPNGLN